MRNSLSLMIWIYQLQTPDLYRETQETKRILLFGWSSKKTGRLLPSFMKFTVGREGKKGMQKTLLRGAQLHQHLCKENLTMIKCTSQLLGEYTLSVLLHLDRM